MTNLLVLWALVAAVAGVPNEDQERCLRCHRTRSPAAVEDWKASRHAREGVGCTTCHGVRHATAQDADRVAMPTADDCGECHGDQHRTWRTGKHARAWDATGAAAGFRHTSAPAGDRRECLECHRVGVDAADARPLRAAGESVGLLGCTACHPNHAFSRIAARQPETCARCHAYDHPQWSAWAASPHGVKTLTRNLRGDADAVAPPTCQDCHFPAGTHAQRTPYGSLGIPLVAPGDEGWAADRAVLLRALGVVDGGGLDGARARPFRDARIGPLDRTEHLMVRAALGDTCRGCHGIRFVRETLARRESGLREADRLSADAVRSLLPLYETGALAGEFPDLVGARASGRLVERRLAEMIFDHRTRYVAALFHGSPAADGWLAALRTDGENVRRLAMEILVLPAQARRGAGAGAGAGAGGGGR